MTCSHVCFKTTEWKCKIYSDFRNTFVLTFQVDNYITYVQLLKTQSIRNLNSNSKKIQTENLQYLDHRRKSESPRRISDSFHRKTLSDLLDFVSPLYMSWDMAEEELISKFSTVPASNTVSVKY